MLSNHVDVTLNILGKTQDITLDVHTDAGVVSAVMWGDNEILGLLSTSAVEELQAVVDGD